MNADSREDGREPSLEWVKRQLRSLATLGPPEELRSKLTAAVPQGAGRGIVKPRRPGRFRGLSYLAAAAAVVVLISILHPKTPLWPVQGPIIDINDSLSRAASADHNSLASVDMNVSDEHYLR